MQHNQGRTLAGTLLAAGAALLLLGSAGCGGGGGNDNAGFGGNGSGSGAISLSGTYDLSGLAASGKSVTCPNSSNTNNVENILTVNNVEADRCYIGENITFSSGSQYTITYPAPRFLNLTQESGNYSIKGNTLTLSRTSRAYDANNDGIITNSEISSVSPSQSLTASITLQNGVLTFTPQTADVSTDIIRAVDGATVVRTYTKRLE